ncbi:unnamed protein product [Brassicogethes aeneus]|uniref:Uncharacterized protein n=1 Tax=Brassicogethes aeneus TaxID=1431903 RepID=A0A9P0FQ70_BRAAE|nr:unnamed protein product [Brassicogethes aeneus]
MEKLKEENQRLLSLVEQLSTQLANQFQGLQHQLQVLTDIMNRDRIIPFITEPQPKNSMTNLPLNLAEEGMEINETKPLPWSIQHSTPPPANEGFPPLRLTTPYVPPSTSMDGQPTQASTDETKHSHPKIPPIILRTKDRWTMISNVMKANGWQFTKAINTAKGVKFFPATIESYRSITKFMQNNEEKYLTYLLPEEKLLQVVIRD